MPLMRKPEMYYYAAECYNNLNNPQKAVDALNAVRVARGILYEKNLPASLSKEEISREIQKEWPMPVSHTGFPRPLKSAELSAIFWIKRYIPIHYTTN